MRSFKTAIWFGLMTYAWIGYLNGYSRVFVPAILFSVATVFSVLSLFLAPKNEKST